MPCMSPKMMVIIKIQVCGRYIYPRTLHFLVLNTKRGVRPSKPIIQRSQQIPQSSYQTHLDAGLDPPPLTTSTVRYWSDYTRVYYHPKSLIQLSEFEVNDKLMPFEKWDVGMELFEKLEREVDLVDRDLRPFVEECDGIQGLQIMTGVDDAWGGWASGWIERLRDEYGKLSVWTWGLGDQGANTATPRVQITLAILTKEELTVKQEKRLQQTVNSAHSLSVLAEQSSVYIPTSDIPAKLPSYVKMDASSPWHVGALQAVALESMTISCRLRSSDGRRGTLSDLEETMNSTGKRRIAKLELSIADPDVLSEKATEQIAQAEKVGSTTSERTKEEDDDQLNEFDIDTFTKDYRTAPSTRKRAREHIFGRVESSRGDWNLSSSGETRDPHDRFREGPALQRYVTSTDPQFPRLLPRYEKKNKLSTKLNSRDHDTIPPLASARDYYPKTVQKDKEINSANAYSLPLDTPHHSYSRCFPVFRRRYLTSETERERKLPCTPV